MYFDRGCVTQYRDCTTSTTMKSSLFRMEIPLVFSELNNFASVTSIRLQPVYCWSSCCFLSLAVAEQTAIGKGPITTEVAEKSLSKLIQALYTLTVSL